MNERALTPVEFRIDDTRRGQMAADADVKMPSAPITMPRSGGDESSAAQPETDDE